MIQVLLVCAPKQNFSVSQMFHHSNSEQTFCLKVGGRHRNVGWKKVDSVFARRTRNGLMKSCLCCHCHHAGPRPPWQQTPPDPKTPPHPTLRPPIFITWQVLRCHVIRQGGCSAFTLTKRTCWKVRFSSGHLAHQKVQTGSRVGPGAARPKFQIWNGMRRRCFSLCSENQIYKFLIQNVLATKTRLELCVKTCSLKTTPSIKIQNLQVCEVNFVMSLIQVWDPTESMFLCRQFLTEKGRLSAQGIFAVCGRGWVGWCHIKGKKCAPKTQWHSALFCCFLTVPCSLHWVAEWGTH